jgi:hypothetical protein
MVGIDTRSPIFLLNNPGYPLTPGLDRNSAYEARIDFSFSSTPRCSTASFARTCIPDSIS